MKKKQTHGGHLESILVFLAICAHGGLAGTENHPWLGQAQPASPERIPTVVSARWKLHILLHHLRTTGLNLSLCHRVWEGSLGTNTAPAGFAFPWQREIHEGADTLIISVNLCCPDTYLPHSHIHSLFKRWTKELVQGTGKKERPWGGKATRVRASRAQD